MKTAKTLYFLVGFAISICTEPARADSVHYLLLGDSTFTDECPVCDRLSFPKPMRGTFDLTLLPTGLGAAQYSVSNITFQVGSNTELITLTGSGKYTRILGHPLSQTLELALNVSDTTTNRSLSFTNQTSEVAKQFPVLEGNVGENPGTLTRSYNLHIVAAPVRELWFSPFEAKTSGGVIPHWGDIVSSNGRLVKSNAALLGSAGINLSEAIDAFDVIPGGEIAFSPAAPVYSDLFGVVEEGDLISTKGSILKRNSDLVSAFVPAVGTASVGLDAVQVLDSGEIYFSTRTNFFSTKRNVLISHGDILSNSGEVIVAGQDLLRAFGPKPVDLNDTDTSFGLTAFYIWPASEIWFSTSKDFISTSLGPISHGDILSDRGYVVFRNALLASNLGGTATVTNRMAGFFVVTDLETAPEPPLINYTKLQPTGVDLKWNGIGRVFQVEEAETLPGSFSPITDLTPDTSFRAPRDPSAQAGYFRLRQW